MKPEILRIGKVTIELLPDGGTITKLGQGMELVAYPQDNITYRERALELGYGANTALMSREHEIAHSLLAYWVGLKHSPTFEGVAKAKHWDHWRAEEAAALGLQTFARCSGIDLVEVARKISRGKMR